MDGLNPRHSPVWLALAVFACATIARAQVAPPPAPPVISAAPFSIESAESTTAQLYSIGDPTNEEQYYLELINRARANPPAEGVRLATTTDGSVLAAYSAFGVNLVLMQSQFALILPAPPLSMNATLLTAARAHSQNMLQNNYQGHSGPDGSLTTRLASYTSGANGWSNGFYDPGEGVGGVTVTVSNVNSYAVTAASGGYSVPIPGSGNYTVTYSGGGVPTNQRNVSVVNAQNVKSDYVVTGSVTPTPTPSPGAPRLANISTRAVVGTNANVLIGGFIVTGTQSKKVIVRGIGPSLSLPGKILDPALELHDSSGALIASNDNWGQNANSPEIANSGVAPSDPNEAAILMSLAPGSYTAVRSGVNQTTGTAVVEVYDLDSAADSKLANISTRAFVQTVDNVLIGGLIVVGPSAADVIVRAIGPSLTVPGAMADPILELRDASGTLLASNDNWRSTQQTAIINTGVAPTCDAESAIVTSFSPGSYTAIVRGANGTTGVAVVEVYQLN